MSVYGRQSGLPGLMGFAMPPVMPQMPSVGYDGLGFAIPFFDSWGWRHRKLLATGGVAVLGVGLLAAVSAILR